MRWMVRRFLATLLMSLASVALAQSGEVALVTLLQGKVERVSPLGKHRRGPLCCCRPPTPRRRRPTSPSRRSSSRPRAGRAASPRHQARAGQRRGGAPRGLRARLRLRPPPPAGAHPGRGRPGLLPRVLPERRLGAARGLHRPALAPVPPRLRCRAQRRECLAAGGRRGGDSASSRSCASAVSPTWSSSATRVTGCTS